MISIIIPVYNVEKYLDQCLESVINQSYTDYECILINDGSTDKSGKICDKWAKKDDRFRVIHQVNQGVSCARNKGINIAKGEYLFFLDGDDVCKTNLFESLKKHDLYIGEYETISTQSSVIKKRHVDYVNKNNYALSFLKEEINTRIGSFIVKKSVLQQNTIYFNSQYKYGEDLEFILKIILCSDSIFLENKSYIQYRLHSESAMQQISLDRFDVFFSRIKLIEFAKKCQNYQVVKYLYDYSCIESIVEVSKHLLRNNFSCKKLKHFFKQNPIIIETLVRNTQKKYKYSSILLRKYIYFYSIIISIESFIYKLRYNLGIIKIRLLK